MAEAKKRKIISAAEAKGGKGAKAKKQRKNNANPNGGDTKGLRIAAIVLWVLAIGFEVAAIYMLNIADTTMMIVAIVLDGICVIVGSLLWKKANRSNPCKSDSKFVKFIWDQMGVIAALVAFIPLGLFLIKKADHLDPKMKKIITVIAAVVFLGSVGSSIDYNPTTVEDVQVAKIEQAAAGQSENFDGTFYWTRYGKSYHADPDCQTLRNSSVLIQGSLAEAFEQKRNDPCDFCVGDVSDIDVSAIEESAEEEGLVDIDIDDDDPLLEDAVEEETVEETEEETEEAAE